MADIKKIDAMLDDSPIYISTEKNKAGFMKKMTTILVLVTVLALGLAGCGKANKDAENKKELGEAKVEATAMQELTENIEEKEEASKAEEEVKAESSLLSGIVLNEYVVGEGPVYKDYSKTGTFTFPLSVKLSADYYTEGEGNYFTYNGEQIKVRIQYFAEESKLNDNDREKAKLAQNGWLEETEVSGKDIKTVIAGVGGCILVNYDEHSYYVSITTKDPDITSEYTKLLHEHIVNQYK